MSSYVTITMDFKEASSRFGSLRTLSSSSSAFFSANQSPLFSPKLETCSLLPANSDNQHDTTSRHIHSPKVDEVSKVDFDTFSELHNLDNVSSSVGINSRGTTCDSHHPDEFRVHSNKDKSIDIATLPETSPPPASSSFSFDRLRCCDVYIGFHGRKPLLLTFANWLRAELELQGLSCFLTDRSRCRNSHNHRIVAKSMDACTYGVVILTKKSFRNPYTIDELRFFSSKKNLVPVYFDLSPEDCLVRDIIERRGELWEVHGGELWLLYGGREKEWRDAVNSLSRVDEWKLEAHDGKWRDCILRGVSLLALRLGRRCIVDRLSKWREKAEKEEFPYPRNESFVGRKKELSELEFMLFGNACGGVEKDYFELKTKTRKKRLMKEERDQLRENRKRKGKEPVLWKESEKDIEMQLRENRNSSVKKHGRRKRSMKIVYGKGIASVTGEAGIGKTELLLEFAYQFHQRYKLVLWIGGESRYIHQNFLNLWSFLEIDIGAESSAEKGSRTKSFEEQEEAAIARVRKELMRNIPFLLIIDNVESEKDWWDHRLIMDLLPRFGGETHVIISSSLSRIMNLEPLRLSYLSEVEAMSLMQGSMKDVLVTEFDALRAIEEKLGRLTLGLAIVGALLSELPITPNRLLDTINRTSSRDISEDHLLSRNGFLLQLFEVCFSIFDHADGPRSLAARMVLASGWFAPSPIPTSLLALAAHNIPAKHHSQRLWKKIVHLLTRGFTSSYARRSEAEASSLLLRFNVARSCTKEGFIQFNELVRQYSRRRGMAAGVAQATVQAVISRGSITLHPDHIWAAYFLLLRFGKDHPAVVKLKVEEVLFLVKEMILPLAIRTFLTFSRCSAAMELLRLATDTLETMDQEFVAPVEKWLDKSICWRPVQTNAQLNPCLWQELTLARANLLEVRAKLMARGGQFDIGDDLIRRAIFIRSSICGEDHPDTISAKETLTKLNRLSATFQRHTSP